MVTLILRIDQMNIRVHRNTSYTTPILKVNARNDYYTLIILRCNFIISVITSALEVVADLFQIL
jgi:hypothetical protein